MTDQTVQADLSRRLVHRSFSWFCHAAIEMQFTVASTYQHVAVSPVAKQTWSNF